MKMSNIHGSIRRLAIFFCALLIEYQLTSPFCAGLYRGYYSTVTKTKAGRFTKVGCSTLPHQDLISDRIQDTDSIINSSDEEDNDIDSNPGCPKCYVVISNLQSGSNIGSICRNALAFNVDEVIVVGRKGFRDKMRQADRGAKRRQKFIHFNSVSEAGIYLKEAKNCSIVGIEIMDSAVSLSRLFSCLLRSVPVISTTSILFWFILLLVYLSLVQPNLKKESYTILY